MTNSLLNLKDKEFKEYINMVINHELIPKRDQGYLDTYLEHKKELEKVKK